MFFSPFQRGYYLVSQTYCISLGWEEQCSYNLTDRIKGFCELLPFALKINKQDISGFYFILDYTIKEKFKNNNLSENDFLQLFACYINENLILVTEDKALLEIGGCIAKKERVISLSDLYNIEND